VNELNFVMSINRITLTPLAIYANSLICWEFTHSSFLHW